MSRQHQTLLQLWMVLGWTGVVQEHIWLRAGWGFINDNFPPPSSHRCVYQDAQWQRRDSLSALVSYQNSLLFWICMSVGVRCSPLVLSARWHSFNMNFVICLDSCQHPKRRDNPSASGFIHLAALQYFDCGKCTCARVCVCVLLCLCQSLYLGCVCVQQVTFINIPSFHLYSFIHSFLSVSLCVAKEAAKNL